MCIYICFVLINDLSVCLSVCLSILTNSSQCLPVCCARWTSFRQLHNDQIASIVIKRQIGNTIWSRQRVNRVGAELFSEIWKSTRRRLHARQLSNGHRWHQCLQRTLNVNYVKMFKEYWTYTDTEQMMYQVELQRTLPAVQNHSLVSSSKVS